MNFDIIYSLNKVKKGAVMKTSMVIVCLAIVGCGKSKLTYSRSQSSQADKEQYSNATPIVVENPSQNYNIPAPVEPRVVAPPTIIRPIQQQPFNSATTGEASRASRRTVSGGCRGSLRSNSLCAESKQKISRYYLG